jgi:NAD(P)H-hydrate epimerase
MAATDPTAARPPEECDPFAVSRSRELDRRSIEEHRVPSLLLMEHASIGIALECLARLPAAGARVEVVVGPGNNGGDGLACARHLQNAGVEVTIWELVPPGARAPGSDPAVNLEIARRFGIPVIDASAHLPAPRALPDLRVDAIFGTGLARPPEGIHRLAIERLNAEAAPVLAVDVPSGFDADRGGALGAAVEAAVTVTLGLPKRGFLAPGAERFTGELRCVPIGVSRRLLPAGIPAFPPAPVLLRRAGGGFEVGGGGCGGEAPMERLR